jgi:hypothetical protein
MYGTNYKLFVTDGATGKTDKQITVRSITGFKVASPNAVPDINSDGIEEVAVLITNTSTGYSKLEFYDSVTGKVVKCIYLPK